MASVEQEEHVPARQYVFLAFVTFLNVMNFVDRQLIQSFANFIKPDLGLTNTEFGLLTGFAFIIFYSFAGLFMGMLADKVHRPRLIAAGVAAWSLLTAASGAARGFVTMAIPRMLIGVGESILTPTSMSMLADRFPAVRLGFAAGVYYMGVPLGAGASLVVAGTLGPTIGWRNSFYLLGALGLFAAAAMLLVRETPRRHTLAAEGAPVAPARPPSIREIFRTTVFALRVSPALALTMGGGIALHFILGAAAYEQLWFVQERGFERGPIAFYSGLMLAVGGVIGNLVGGYGSDWWLRRTGEGRPMFLFWVMLILTPILLAYRLVPSDTVWFWAGMFAAFFLLGAFYGPTFSSVQELVPPQIRATVVAFYILLLNLVGLGFGITAGGIMIDLLIAAEIAQPYTWTLLVFTAISALAVPLFYMAGTRFSGDRRRLAERMAAKGGEEAPAGT